MIPRHKIGDCCKCNKRATAVRKRGRELICLSCCKMDDTKKQLQKSRERSLPNNKEKTNSDIWEWFNERRKEMTGTCKHCGGATLKNNEKTFYFCIAHILPKAYFPSVSTHPDNWIELCFYGNSCHTNLDNYILDLTDLNCWDEVVTKFAKIYPSIAPQERRRIPSCLLQYIQNEGIDIEHG